MPLTLGDDPMLDTNIRAAVGIGPARDVAGRVNSRDACFKIGVDDDTAIDSEPHSLEKFDARAHADANDHEIRVKRTAAFELHLLCVDRVR